MLPTDIITVWIQDGSSERPHCNLGAVFFFVPSLDVLFGGVACKVRPSSSDLGGMSGMKCHPVMSQTAVCLSCWNSVRARRAEGQGSDDQKNKGSAGAGRLEGKGRTCQGDFTLWLLLVKMRKKTGYGDF